MKKKLPRKTEKVLRDMAKEHFHSNNCLGCLAFAQNHPIIYPPSIDVVHKHDQDACDTCQIIWERGEKFGRENHVVTKCNHPEPLPIVLRITPWSVHMVWAFLLACACAITFILTYGPNWAGAVRP